jgi:hypothetical protein
MNKNIKPFVSRLSYLVEDVSLSDMSYTHKEMIKGDIDKSLFQAIKKFDLQREYIKGKIREYEKNLEMEIQFMRNKFDESVMRLEAIGIKFENGIITLNEITLHLRQGERYSQFTDEEKVKMFNALTAIHEEAYDIVVSTSIENQFIEDKYATFRGTSSTPKIDRKGTLRPGSREAWSDIEIEEALEYVSESIFQNVVSFFKNIFKKNDTEIDVIEQKVERFEDLTNELKKLAFVK